MKAIEIQKSEASNGSKRKDEYRLKSQKELVKMKGLGGMKKQSEILKIDHPQFDEFFCRLQKTLESPRHISRHGYFYKDSEGDLYYGFDEEKWHEEAIRKILGGMEGIDVEATIRWFKSLENFCDCEHCQYVMNLIRPRYQSGES